MAKSIEDRLLAFALIGVASTLAGGIALIVTGCRRAPPSATWWFPRASTSPTSTGLINSYRLGAFNQTYPIARGTSPLVVAVGACFVAHEHLSLLAWTGIVMLALGLMSLALSAGTLTRAELPAIAAALATGLAIAAYTLVDGLGVRRSHDPYAYSALLFLLQGPVYPDRVPRPPAASRLAPVDDDQPRPAAGFISVVAYSARALGADEGTARRGGGIA